MTPWRRVSQYAMSNGTQSISLKYLDGCSMFCLHENGAYTKHSEDEAECVVAATYPDAESMKSYLAEAYSGSKESAQLRKDCREVWARVHAAPSVFECLACYPKLCHCAASLDSDGARRKAE